MNKQFKLKNNLKIIAPLVLVSLFVPALFFFMPIPATAQQADGIKGLIISFKNLVDLLIPLTAAAALLFFFWGLSLFILRAGEEGARDEAKQIMSWGIAALFVIVSIWGIVEFLRSDLGISNIPNLTFPNF